MNNRPSANLSRPGSIQPSSSRLTIAPEAIYQDESVRVIKSHIAPTGESVQLVRPLASGNNATSDEIVKKLVNEFDYKKDAVRANR